MYSVEMIKCVVLLYLAAATVDRLPRLIEAVKGNRIINRGGREMPRALYEATEAHRKLIEKLYSASDNSADIFNRIISYVNSLPVPSILTQEQIAIINDNALKSARIRQDFRGATERAIYLHGTLASLCKFHFSTACHLQEIDEIEKNIEMSLDEMIKSFTGDTIGQYGQNEGAATLSAPGSLSHALIKARIAYADWFQPRISKWSVSRKIKAAKSSLDKSLERSDDVDTDVIEAFNALEIVERECAKKLKGQDSLDIGHLRDEVVRMHFRREASPFFGMIDSADMRMLVQSLRSGYTKVQAKRWENIVQADASVMAAEKEMTRYISACSVTPKTLDEVDERVADLDRGSQTAVKFIAKRRNHRQSLRKFLNSF